MIETGQDLAWARMMLGLSQRELAAKLRLSEVSGHQYVRDMETARRDTPVSGPVSLIVEGLLREAGIPIPGEEED